MDLYQDYMISVDSFVRTFSEDIPTEELVWHRDYRSRRIEVLENDGWQIQFENTIPSVLTDRVFVKQGEYHRIIKGNGRLVIKITEYGPSHEVKREYID
jgi:hypothetical protein